MTERLLVRWLRLAAARVAADRERLTALDAAIGDGDHGINLDRGFAELVLEELDDPRDGRGAVQGAGEGTCDLPKRLEARKVRRRHPSII